jgi:putative tryptophan/tyrosine transport system substrate-binding protein
MTHRRHFIRVVAIALLAVPLATRAQQSGKVPRIAFLGLNSAETAQQLVVAFRQGLRERGWVDGENIIIELRFADGKAERLPALVAQLIKGKIDIIVATSSVTTRIAQEATKTIPIVMTTSADALGEGFVTDLAHPGGNITGMTFFAGPESAGKQLELLKTAIPTAARIAVLTNPTSGAHAAFVRESRIAARAFGVQLQVSEARSPDQLDAAFAAMTRERAQALLVVSDAMFYGQRRRIVDLAATNRLPAMYSQKEFVDAGGLMSYGANLPDMYRRAAGHIDKVLKGTKPGDIPVEQPTTFELVINVKTAMALGLNLPQSLLLRADQVIR